MCEEFNIMALYSGFLSSLAVTENTCLRDKLGFQAGHWHFKIRMIDGEMMMEKDGGEKTSMKPRQKLLWYLANQGSVGCLSWNTLVLLWWILFFLSSSALSMFPSLLHLFSYSSHLSFPQAKNNESLILKDACSSSWESHFLFLLLSLDWCLCLAICFL